MRSRFETSIFADHSINLTQLRSAKVASLCRCKLLELDLLMCNGSERVVLAVQSTSSSSIWHGQSLSCGKPSFWSAGKELGEHELQLRVEFENWPGSSANRTLEPPGSYSLY